jgi:alpha-tubulin suppressor-like RCC1 family protein
MCRLDKSCAILDDGSLSCWGRVDFSVWSPASNSRDVASPAANVKIDGEVIQQACMGALHICALTDRSNTYCLGKNEVGQLGLPEAIEEVDAPGEPINFGDGGQAKSIACSRQSACSILGDNSVSCWGSNDSGELGTKNGVFWSP